MTVRFSLFRFVFLHAYSVNLSFNLIYLLTYFKLMTCFVRMIINNVRYECGLWMVVKW
uniref:Uncharacterized protein n=1 Tax=Anguilla anguilla TaxID=7936 RepID=A0A0E9U5Z2_ANGAN